MLFFRKRSKYRPPPYAIVSFQAFHLLFLKFVSKTVLVFSVDILLWFFCVCVFVHAHIRFELENRLSELEQLRALQEETGTTKNQEFEDRLRGAWRAEKSARKELQNIKYSHFSYSHFYIFR